MISDTTGPLTDAEIADICEALDPIPDDSLDGMLTWIGPDWPTMQRIMADLIATRAELADMRRVVAEARSGEDDARLAAIAASIRPDTLVSLHPDDAMWLVRRARVAAATASTEQGRV